jgi:hypothetical protein
LPMLAGAGIDNIPKQNMLEEWSKKKICDIIMEGSRAWVAAQPVVYSILTDHTYRHLCTVLASGRPGPNGLHIPWADFFPKNTCAAIQNACFQSAEAHQLVDGTRSGRKRSRSGMIKPGGFLPWLRAPQALLNSQVKKNV